MHRNASPSQGCSGAVRIGAPRARRAGTPLPGAAPAPPPADAPGTLRPSPRLSRPRQGPRPGAAAEPRDRFFGNNGIVESWNWALLGTRRSSSPASHAQQEFPTRRAVLSPPPVPGLFPVRGAHSLFRGNLAGFKFPPLRCVTLIRALDLSGPK